MRKQRRADQASSSDVPTSHGRRVRRRSDLLRTTSRRRRRRDDPPDDDAYDSYSGGGLGEWGVVPKATTERSWPTSHRGGCSRAPPPCSARRRADPCSGTCPWDPARDGRRRTGAAAARCRATSGRKEGGGWTSKYAVAAVAPRGPAAADHRRPVGDPRWPGPLVANLTNIHATQNLLPAYGMSPPIPFIVPGYLRRNRKRCDKIHPGDKRQLKSQDVTAKLVRFDILRMVPKKKLFCIKLT
jgi:hypothetical protein